MKIIKTKIFKMLFYVFLIGIILGIISFFILNKSDKFIVKDNIISLIDNIKLGSVKYPNTIFLHVSNNLKIISIIWILGLLCLASFIVPFIVVYKGIILSFDVISIIYAYGFKGFILSFLYVFPSIIINILLLFVSYYAINQSIRTYKLLKSEKMISLKKYVKNYVLIYLILSLLLVILSILEIFFISFIVKLVV